jgi:uncharacterized damage-inducible protein DinB
MSKFEELLATWKDVREGYIEEIARIPEDKLDYRPTTETRSILEITHHIVESERMLAGEICRDDTDIRRVLSDQPDNTVREATSGEGLKNLLRTSLDETAQAIRQFGEDKLDRLMTGFDGKDISKFSMLNFVVGHEMYHRGQLTVYQRLLGIEPALTEQFRKLLGQ